MTGAENAKLDEADGKGRVRKEPVIKLFCTHLVLFCFAHLLNH